MEKHNGEIVSKQDYNDGIVREASERYIAYIERNWKPTHASGIMSEKQWRGLKQRAFKHIVSAVPGVAYAHAEWRALLKKHGPTTAHKSVETFSQETGRQILLHLARAVRTHIVGKYEIMRPDGSLVGTWRRDEEEVLEPVAEKELAPLVIKPSSNGDGPTVNPKFYARLIKYATETGSLPNDKGVSILFDIEQTEAGKLLDLVNEVFELEIEDAHYKAKPREIDTNRFLELLLDANEAETKLLRKLVGMIA